MIKNDQPILIAVSGGPDSMFLLNKFYKKNYVIAAFVNYNQRSDSNIDQKIVEEFCFKNNIVLEKLILNKSDYTKGNFQDWARITRYNFFKEMYKKHNCKKLLVAQHKDDFIENYFLQKTRKKDRLFFGIDKKSELFDMYVERPLINRYFKKQIIKQNMKNNLIFANDYTNHEPKYKRNEIRLELSNKSILLKEFLFLKIKLLNLKLSFKRKKIEYLFKKWKENAFDQNCLNKDKYNKYLVYKYLNNNFTNINLSSSKIESIIEFIKSDNRTSQYKLDESNYLIKKRGKLIN
ncbi:tRNA lysidine(34) synthetase TilS [Mycoplasmopsis alligatoris]|uniref:tRNA(Ile)-lysidine synthase n=1 Tax=Mycoplasmopsis alligatoris A21JP2 TaxID=747682 RepID=D4XWH8_9BACT|nr:tRNA lysidine(34) synthetase TilS [Mycoplasmopsis alligatoris]EFF41186.1 tRNA(Ile)-lysidine synthetase [Mycoplasmopsis alligatoris A21JP2]